MLKKQKDKSLERALLKYEKPRRRFSLRKLAVGLIAVSLLVPLLAKVMSNDRDIRAGRAELAALQERERQLVAENEELQRYFEDDDFEEYLEENAREAGYADPQERVFNIY
ncbi:MAG: septum formation initiator family protein [Oscillospiraceae bacterium]|nr:septum formation initiator family protein [Oscillospiraceae bacterium]